MSFVSDELANVLKSVYMKEDSGKDEGADSSLNVDKNNGVVSKEKRSRKHKHKKHSSKSKSKDKKKHKKRKHRSRSRSRSESRSRSKSRSSEREHSSKPSNRRSVSSNSRSKSPGVMEHDDFVLEKAENTIEVKVCKSTKEESGCTSKETVEAESTPESDLKETLKETFESNCQKVSESKTLNIEEQRVSVQTSCSEEKGDSLASGSVTLSDQKDGSQRRNELQEKVTDTMWTESPLHSKSRSQSKERVPGSIRKNSASLSSSRSRSKEKVTDSKTKKSSSHSRSRSRSKEKGSNSKMKKSVSSSRSRSRSVGDKSFRNSKQRRSRSHSRGRKSKRRSKSRSSSKESSHHKRSRSRSHARNKSSKRRFKSRSHSGEQNCKRHVSKSRSRSYSNSKSRSRSPRHTRTHSRSRRKSPLSRNFRKFSPPHWRRCADSARGRSGSRSHRSRSKRRSSSRRRQSHSRSNSRRRFQRSQSRSRGRRSRTRSRSRLRNRKSRSKSRGRRNRSRSRSPSYSTGRSRRSTSRGRKRSKSRSRSKSGSKEKTEPNSSLSISSANTALESKVSSNIDKPGATSLSSQQAKVAQRAGGKTIAELTAFCKKLQEEKEGAGNETKEGTKTEEEESQTVTHHPFLVKEMPDITIPPVIFPVNMNKPSVPTVDPSKPLQEQFPVSCGSKHREKEVVDDGAGILANVDGSAIPSQPKSEIPVFAPPSTEKFDISELVAKRMDAQRRLQTDPNDIEALLMLQEIQMKMQNWCQSNVKPGQFTGELVKNLLPKEHLQGGFQAWAKKDMFQNLTPVSGGIGMKLLQKMGWKPGQVIGKRGEGYAEPIALTVKIDRKGLSTGKEKATKKGAPAVLDLQGKHPVSALAEYCSKRKWQLPDYSLVFDQGPAHHKQFLFKVLVNGTEYQPAVVCGNKKQAKAQAAIFALKGLGLIPEDADISSL